MRQDHPACLISLHFGRLSYREVQEITGFGEDGCPRAPGPGGTTFEHGPLGRRELGPVGGRGRGHCRQGHAGEDRSAVHEKTVGLATLKIAVIKGKITHLELKDGDVGRFAHGE